MEPVGPTPDGQSPASGLDSYVQSNIILLGRLAFLIFFFFLNKAYYTFQLYHYNLWLHQIKKFTS